MAKYFNANELDYIDQLLGDGTAPGVRIDGVYTHQGNGVWGRVDALSLLEEEVDELMMEQLGYGLQDMVGYGGRLDSGLLHPPWIGMEWPWHRRSRPEAEAEGFVLSGVSLEDMSVDPAESCVTTFGG